jgi:hypothetical protein
MYSRWEGKELGTHEELLTLKDGIYAELVALQVLFIYFEDIECQK